MVSVCGFHDLHPLDLNLVLSAFVLSLVDWQVSNLAKTEDTSSPVDEELELLLDRIPDKLEHALTNGTRVLRNVRFELASVLVDSLDILRVEVNLEVVGPELGRSPCSTS